MRAGGEEDVRDPPHLRNHRRRHGQGDAFADEWVFVGTHTGPLQLPDGTVLAATGKRVEMPGMEFVQVRDGKIVVDNPYYDNLAVTAQFGLLPQPATAS